MHKHRHLCPVCKQHFIVPDQDQWAYRILLKKSGRKIPVCSWRCLRATEKETGRSIGHTGGKER